MNLAQFPRRGYVTTPTPIEHCPNFSKALGADIDVYIKRDDMLPGTAGGNKTRKLDFCIADALQKGCDTVIDDVVVVGYKNDELPDTKGKIISIRHTSVADSVSAPVLEVKSGDMKNITISNSTTSLAAADPVYVVDGKKVENISDIKVEDIESVTVFKDSTEIVKQYDALGKGLIFISLKKK